MKSITALMLLLLPAMLFSQQWEWIQTITGISVDDQVYDVQYQDDHVYICGRVQDSITIDGSKFWSGAFIAKLDTSGNLAWFRGIQSNQNEQNVRMAVTADGNAYVAGDFDYSATFAGQSLQNVSGKDMYVGRLDKNGNGSWFEVADIGSWYFMSDMETDADENLYMAFTYWDTLRFADSIRVSSVNQDAMLIRMDSSGNITWMSNIGGAGNEMISAITVEAGVVTITGDFQDSITLGTTTHYATGEYGIYVASVDQMTGNVLSSMTFGGPSKCYVYDMKVTASGEKVLSGTYEDTLTTGLGIHYSTGLRDIFLTTVQANQLSQLAVFGGSGYDWARDIWISPSGQIFLTGSFENTLILGQDTLVQQGMSGDFLAFKTDTAFSPIWAISGSNLTGSAVSGDSQGHIYFGGDFQTPAMLDTFQLNGNTAYDGWVGKLQDSTFILLQSDVQLAKNPFVLYPNPGTDKLFFRSEKPVSIILSDVRGRIILKTDEKMSGVFIPAKLTPVPVMLTPLGS